MDLASLPYCLLARHEELLPVSELHFPSLGKWDFGITCSHLFCEDDLVGLEGEGIEYKVLKRQ